MGRDDRLRKAELACHGLLFDDDGEQPISRSCWADVLQLDPLTIGRAGCRRAAAPVRPHRSDKAIASTGRL